MKVIKPSVKRIDYDVRSCKDMWSAIEYAARVCYNSQNKMSSDSEKWVTDTIIKSGHNRALEFGTVYLKVPFWRLFTLFRYAINPWSKVRRWNCVTTNYRVVYENGWKKHLEWWGYTDKHAHRTTFHWTISRVTADSFRTHCSISSLMQSTRFCLYSLLRNAGELTFVKPQWFDKEQLQVARAELMSFWKKSEECYMKLVSDGCVAQEARESLLLSLKTEFVQCAFDSDWDKFFALRAEVTEHNNPHPDAIVVAKQAKMMIG